MSLESELINRIFKLMEGIDWEQQVRFAWFKRFGICLVSLTHPQYALQLIQQVNRELAAPDEICSIFFILITNKDELNDKDKIAAVKKIIQQEGYTQANPPTSWKRTSATHEVLMHIAAEIHSYEAECNEAFTKTTLS